MREFIRLALFVMGIVVAIIGAGLDFLLPSASPGFNLPQLLIVCAGLALSGAAALLWRARFRSSFVQLLKRNLVSASIISLVTLLALEILLTVLGAPTYFPRQLPDSDLKVISWKTCDVAGCRLNYEANTAACAAGELSGRNCIVNRQGYPDAKDFVVSNDIDNRFRIATLGDSFTQGFSADIGKSYVEYLDAEIPGVEIWNFAIGGTGTHQDLHAYQEYAPAFKPQLSILGFSMTDFQDNLQLSFTGLQLQDSDGNIYFPDYPKRDRWGRPIQLPQALVLSYAVAGSKPPMSDLEARLGLTRLGTIGIRLLDRAGSAVYDRSIGEVATTRDYLAQLRGAALALDSGFLVLLIPALEDIGNPGKEMASAIKLMEELDIHYLNPISLLKEEDYVPQPDGHWNNAGHQKIGALVGDCVQRLIDSGSLAACSQLNMP